MGKLYIGRFYLVYLKFCVNFLIWGGGEENDEIFKLYIFLVVIIKYNLMVLIYYVINFMILLVFRIYCFKLNLV